MSPFVKGEVEKGFAGQIVSVPGDVRDESLLKNLFETHKPAWVLHAAAHSLSPARPAP
ncbi:MAG: polysaccharide biosynthesis protein [Elusimicrobiota bacterium]|nr:polysaccharide biosynthesis protein [Elusimicrobiota bacterium]